MIDTNPSTNPEFQRVLKEKVNQLPTKDIHVVLAFIAGEVKKFSQLSLSNQEVYLANQSPEEIQNRNTLQSYAKNTHSFFTRVPGMFESAENEMTVDTIIDFLNDNLENLDSLEYSCEDFTKYLFKLIDDISDAMRVRTYTQVQVPKTIIERIFGILSLNFSKTKKEQIINPELTLKVKQLRNKGMLMMTTGGTAINKGINYLVDKKYIQILNETQKPINHLSDHPNSKIIFKQKLIDKITPTI